MNKDINENPALSKASVMVSADCKKYRIVKKTFYYDGTWFYIEKYKEYFFKVFNNWERLTEDAPVSVDMVYGVCYGEKQDVCFRTEEECKNYIKLV